MPRRRGGLRKPPGNRLRKRRPRRRLPKKPPRKRSQKGRAAKKAPAKKAAGKKAAAKKAPAKKAAAKKVPVKKAAAKKASRKAPVQRRRQRSRQRRRRRRRPRRRRRRPDGRRNSPWTGTIILCKEPALAGFLLGSMGPGAGKRKPEEMPAWRPKICPGEKPPTAHSPRGVATMAMPAWLARATRALRSKSRVRAASMERQLAPAAIIASMVATPMTGTSKRIS